MEGDRLFFKQLLQPMFDPSKFSIKNDPRMQYYKNIKNWTEKYVASISMYSSCGHNYKTVTVEELLQWDSCVIMSRLNGYLKSAMYCCLKPDDKPYDNKIADAMIFLCQ